ncbi:MAG: hypothetical protein RR227_05470, partial [Oscillospiraceae bacterium]
MKAIIVEIKGKFVAALSDDGTVIRMKNENFAVGQVIDAKKITVTKTKALSRFAAAAAGFMLVCGLGFGGIYAYKTPASYVSMDVNPSIEYTLNMFDRVLEVEAVNDDGTKILQKITLENLTNKTIDDAIALTLDEINREGYLKGEGGIVIATSGKKSAASEELAAHLKSLITAQCAENKNTVSIESMAVSREQLDEAKAQGVTPGKLILVQKLMAEHPHDKTLSAEEWLKKPVKEIMAKA